MTARPAAVIVLSAGDGTRMKSSLNKALHRIGGRTLVGHAVAAAAGSGADHVVVVVRAQAEAVADAAREVFPQVVIATQDDVYGTGRAAECGLLALPDDLEGTVLVTTGDTPLLSSDTLQTLAVNHAESGAGVTVISGIRQDATGYGRIVRDDSGAVQGIVEHKQASPEQLQITEFNSGIFAFDAGLLREALAGLGVNEVAGEKYLTDVVHIAVSQGKPVRAYVLDDLWQTEGVNDKAQLARLGRELNRRTLDALMCDQGAIIIDPDTTWVDVEVTVGRDTIVRPGCQLLGATSIGENCDIGPDSTLKDTEVLDGAHVVRTHAELALVGENATVGPFAYLRPGSELGTGSKVGTYVETKNSQLGPGAKVPHLSYIGDTTVGEGTNIGAASVTVNYDGVNKHRTTIGAHCRMGSDTMYVAPVTIGDGAGSGAGAVIRKDVPPGALAISVAPQRNIEGWVQAHRPGTPQAKAAEAALADAATAEGDGPADPAGRLTDEKTTDR